MFAEPQIRRRAGYSPTRSNSWATEPKAPASAIRFCGALSSRNGQPGGVPTDRRDPTWCAMSTEQWLDFVAISMDPKKAEGIKFTINLATPDNGEQFVVEISNATLTTVKGSSRSLISSSR